MKKEFGLQDFHYHESIISNNEGWIKKQAQFPLAVVEIKNRFTDKQKRFALE